MARDDGRIGISWMIGTEFGWGLYGYHIAWRLHTTAPFTPMLLSETAPLDQDVLMRDRFKPVLDRLEADQDARAEYSNSDRLRIGYPVLHALGNFGIRSFVEDDIHFEGSRNHGLYFIENTRITDKARQRLQAYDTLVGGSTWNRDVLEGHGFKSVSSVIQGVDQGNFHPAPKRNLFPDRFVIFSGGKLEFRKGQDIVLEAVRIFKQRHPETLLLTVWGNSWLESQGIDWFRFSPHRPDIPDLRGEARFNWQGLFNGSDFEDRDAAAYGLVKHRELPGLMREADVAIFPNRVEGGTNMVAMQAMACGVPTILSANTGHLDILVEGGCYPLTRQTPVAVDQLGLGTDGWGESDIEEIVASLEQVYQDRQSAAETGLAGARAMHELPWARQIGQLMATIGETR